MKTFEELIGQSHIKARLNFALKAKKVDRPIPAFLFIGGWGAGKTRFAKSFAAELDGQDFLEINCGGVKDIDAFIHIFADRIQDQELTVLFDECHQLPNDLVTVLLTVLNTGGDPIRTVSCNGYEMEFDFSRQTFLFATTEPQKLFAPLKSRMEALTIESYTDAELQEIIDNNCPGIVLTDDTLKQLVESSRGTPRSCVQISEKVLDFCKINRKKIFGAKDLVSLRAEANVRLHGLEAMEVEILGLLKKNGPMMLKAIASTLNLSVPSVSLNYEQFLMKKGLIKIDGKRMITPKGMQVLKEVAK